MDPVTMALIGGGLTGGGVLAKRKAEREAARQRAEHEAQALAARRQATEHRMEASREEHASKMGNLDALQDALPGMDVGERTADIRAALAEAHGPGEEPQVLGPAAGEGDALPAPATPDSPYQSAQKVSEARVSDRARRRGAMRRAAFVPHEAGLADALRVGALSETMHGGLRDARVARDAGTSQIMASNALGDLYAQLAQRVTPDVPLWAQIGLALGPSMMGYGMGAGMGGGAGAGAGPALPGGGVTQAVTPANPYVYGPGVYG